MFWPWKRKQDSLKSLNVFYDTSILIELLYRRPSTERLSASEKAFFLRAVDRCSGYISPITWVEFYYHSFVRELLGRGVNRPHDIIGGKKMLPINWRIADHYMNMGIPHNRRPGALDAWQIVLADFHGYMLATVDAGMIAHATQYGIPILSPETYQANRDSRQNA